MCCGHSTNSSPIRITSARRSRTGPGQAAVRVADPTPLAITDDVLFRWSRIVQIAKLFPVMHTIRALEQKLQTACRGCKGRHRLSELDRSCLAEARRHLAECPDTKARAVKTAAGILQYRVHYHDLAGTAKEVVR